MQMTAINNSLPL